MAKQNALVYLQHKLFVVEQIRKVLERIKETGDIFWAQSDRDWILDGATVHVSMIGFDDGRENRLFLDDEISMQ